jgi:hypothetical protein
MKTTLVAAVEVLLGLTPLHVMTEAEDLAATYTLTCNQQWRPKSTDSGHTKKFWDMEQIPFLYMGSDMMLPTYA